MIEPVSMILLPVLINVVTGPIDAPQLLQKIKRQPKPMNHDLQKAIKIAYVQALIAIATKYRGKIPSFQPFLKPGIIPSPPQPLHPALQPSIFAPKH